MKSFSDSVELLHFAESFLKERIESLEKDVGHCLKSAYAPFPGFLYCFSTIDLLGALYAGNAEKSRDSRKHSISYMKDFMDYSEEQTCLLIDIFRNKVVHLAQPKPLFIYNGKNISWGYWHNDRSHHLKLVPLNPPLKDSVASGVNLDISHRFEISIAHFVNDIRVSVFEPAKFFHSLKKENGLQNNFDAAISQIHNPTL